MPNTWVESGRKAESMQVACLVPTIPMLKYKIHWKAGIKEFCEFIKSSSANIHEFNLIKL
jgi:hypothetical protein